ncbi:R3H-associated N-terminal domain-containing protein [Echria macrotheca]|uniref:R3H-associated N-terminal domain-containing protein n=1 Tax=Echria macrotheca TaxID=438768 RepID=A0AAJ0B197_9PEZI|nr:R3H-associated N-terminal domain-containing protein [Echria macrotheca]
MAIETLPVNAHDGDDHSEPSSHHHPSHHPPHPLHQHALSNASTATVDVEAWTADALASLTISPSARGTGGSALSIPLDAVEHPASSSSRPRPLKLRNVGFETNGGAGITPPRRPPSRRDSTKRREELLKGKEGSRQRRRWENDHLLHVPNVQPPLPTDWQVHPTYPVLPTVPYALAQYWDKGLRERVEERKAAFANHHHHHKRGGGGEAANVIPRDLRNTAKRTPAVKSWLRVLEEPVRQFLIERGCSVEEEQHQKEEELSSSSEEDDEVVFVGRNGSMMDARAWKRAQRRDKETKKTVEAGMVLDTTTDGGDGEGGAFRRFLTHSISEYYGLSSKSVTVGNPARRVVYIGLKQTAAASHRHAPPPLRILPPPLWEMF